MFSFNRITTNLRRMLGINNRYNNRYNIRCLYKVINGEEIKKFVFNKQNIILDVRDEEEFQNMHIINAINIPANKIDSSIFNIISDKKTAILVYCSTGERTNYAICRLNNLGYSNLYMWGNGGINTLTVRDILEYK